jgi:hypothetical protein
VTVAVAALAVADMHMSMSMLDGSPFMLIRWQPALDEPDSAD